MSVSWCSLVRAAALHAKLRHEATNEELAEATGLPLEYVEGALAAADSSASLQQTVGEDCELGDLLADEAAVDPVEQAHDSLRRGMIRAAVSGLPERERRIVELRYGFDGLPHSVDSVASELGLSPAQVRRLEQAAMDKLTRELEGLASSQPVDDDELAQSV